jgi:hypothetical protein
MRADELMLFDWVYGVDGNRETPSCIAAVDIYPTNKTPRVVVLGGYGYQQENIKPVMITKEILKANGFKEDPEDGTMCWGNKELEEVTWRGTILKIDSLSASLELVSCMYLHQLQHALKLCGIGIEITL